MGRPISGTELWSVFRELRQCTCGDVDLARPEEPRDACRACGSDDGPASVCEVELLVPLDDFGELAGDIVATHGYTLDGPGLLGGEIDVGPWLSRRAEREVVEAAEEAREMYLREQAWERRQNDHEGAAAYRFRAGLSS